MVLCCIKSSWFILECYIGVDLNGGGNICFLYSGVSSVSMSDVSEAKMPVPGQLQE